jgi:hypothetical protein
MATGQDAGNVRWHSNLGGYVTGRETFYSCVCEDPRGQKGITSVQARSEPEARDAFALTYPDEILIRVLGPFFVQKERVTLGSIIGTIRAELRHVRDAAVAIKHQFLVRRIRRQHEKDARIARHAKLIVLLARAEDGDGWVGTLCMPGKLSLQNAMLVVSVSDDDQSMELSFQDANEPTRGINDASLITFESSNPVVRMNPLVPGTWKAVVRSPANLLCERGLRFEARRFNRYLTLTIKDEK